MTSIDTATVRDARVGRKFDQWMDLTMTQLTLDMGVTS